jgi:hypothetical protein
MKLWDARSGAEIRSLVGHTNLVSAVAFSPDGSRLASASWDETVKLWDARSGAEALTLRGHTGVVWAVAFSPDGSRLASASEDKTLRLWDGHSGTEVLTLRGPTGPVHAVAFSPDGGRMASASYDTNHITSAEVTVWDAESGIETPKHLYDAWAEDDLRRQAWATTWHAEDAAEAEKDQDWFAAAFHRGCLADLRPWDASLRLLEARRWVQASQLQRAAVAVVRALLVNPAGGLPKDANRSKPGGKIKGSGVKRRSLGPRHGPPVRQALHPRQRGR